MPKINNIHKLYRLRERIEQLERGEEVAIKDINTLITKQEQQALKDAWAHEKHLRETKAIKQSDWKSPREVRISVLKQILAEMKSNAVSDFENYVEQLELKAAKIFLDAYFDAMDNGQDPMSKADIALQRNGFQPVNRAVRHYTSKRDREVQEMEDALRKRFESEMTEEEREQMELAREYDAELEKRSKK